jgi:dihydrolipoamide dehydrogenase
MDYDVIVIGSGPAGYTCAIELSKYGKKVLIIEKDELGGVCTNTGCIPTKSLIESADPADISKTFKHVEKTVLISQKGVEKLLNDANIEVQKGVAQLVDKNTVEVEGEKITTDFIVIATGACTKTIPGVEIDNEFVLDNKSIQKLGKIPQDLMIVGGGFIGMEYAGIYAKLGSKVTVIEALDNILITEDDEVIDFIKKKYSSQMQIKTSAKLKTINPKTKKVTVEEEGVEKTYNPTHILFCVGRKPNTKDLGLESVGVEVDAGIKVNPQMKTNIENIYAIGDVTSQQMLAHVAYMHAKICAKNICSEKLSYNPTVVPWVVFTNPPIAHCGLTQKQAEKEYEIGVGRAVYAANGKAAAMGARNGFAKVVIDTKTDLIVGIHVVGVQSDSLIGEAAVIINNNLTTSDVLETIHPHPTLTELIYDAIKNASTT